MAEFTEVVARDIARILWNTEDSYMEIAWFTRKAESKHDVAELIADRYYQAINEALGEMAQGSLAYYLVGEMCLMLPFSIFEDLAEDFWEAERGDNDERTA